MVTHKDLVFIVFFATWLLADNVFYILCGLNTAFTCNLIGILLLGVIILFKLKCKRFRIWLEKEYKKK